MDNLSRSLPDLPTWTTNHYEMRTRLRLIMRSDWHATSNCSASCVMCEGYSHLKGQRVEGAARLNAVPTKLERPNSTSNHCTIGELVREKDFESVRLARRHLRAQAASLH
jgi:hypothetical protein